MRIVGTGTRVLEFLIDMFIVVVITIIANRSWDFYVFYYRIFEVNFFYFLAATGFFYYLFCESIWKRTPGKWFALSKVVTLQGTRPSFIQIFVRSLVRIAGCILLDSIFLSFVGKTLHDLVSRTVVIEI